MIKGLLVNTGRLRPVNAVKKIYNITKLMLDYATSTICDEILLIDIKIRWLNSSTRYEIVSRWAVPLTR